MEDPYAIVKEPDNIYTRFLQAPMYYWRNNNFLFDSNCEISLEAILCDGAPDNNERVGGGLRLIEIYWERQFQGLIFLFLANELPLRHIFETIGGQTSGPKTFNGTIGNIIERNVNKL